MIRLFVIDCSAMRHPVVINGKCLQLSDDAFATAKNAGLADGIPFILNADGSCDHELNRFFRECPSMGLRSPNSLRSYARDLVTWMRFLADVRGKSVWQADGQDVIAYHRARRQGPSPNRIAAVSWNRSIAALEKFYGWAKQEGLVTVPPFSYRQGLYRAHGAAHILSGPVNRAYEPAARQQDMRFVALDRFLLFRDVGLRGRLPDGSEDHNWRGRNGERNALFAELLVTTGLRLTEASAWLTMELPRLETFTGTGLRSIPYLLPSAIAKGSKGREIRLPLRILRQLTDYTGLERANAVERFIARTPWQRGANTLRMMGHDRGIAFLTGDDDVWNRVRIDQLTPADRFRLVHCTAEGVLVEPAVLWLTETGSPVTQNDWEAVFRRASQRCRELDIDIEVTPHTLRHTFAVHMLSRLIQAQIGTVIKNRSSAEQHGAAYQRMIGDPLQKLQHLLGHASIASTYVYLDSLEECRELVDTAANALAADIDGDTFAESII
jgi:site-specific recombinase XerD